MEQKYILGLKGLANYFNLSVAAVVQLIKTNSIPGVMKLRRQPGTNFTGGGRGVWALHRSLAEKYQHTRLNTPRYDPRKATEALLNKYAGTGCESIPELVDGGYMTDMEWCDELNKLREESNMHVPILMHPADLAVWFGGKNVEKITNDEIFPATAEIFGQIRRRRS